MASGIVHGWRTRLRAWADGRAVIDEEATPTPRLLRAADTLLGLVIRATTKNDGNTKEKNKHTNKNTNNKPKSNNKITCLWKERASRQTPPEKSNEWGKLPGS